MRRRASLNLVCAIGALGLMTGATCPPSGAPPAVTIYYDQPLNFSTWGYARSGTNQDIAWNGAFACFRIKSIENNGRGAIDFNFDPAKVTVLNFPPGSDPTKDRGNFVPYATRPAVVTSVPAGQTVVPPGGSMVFKVQVGNPNIQSEGDISGNRFRLIYNDPNRQVTLIPNPPADPAKRGETEANDLATLGI